MKRSVEGVLGVLILSLALQSPAISVNSVEGPEEETVVQESSSTRKLMAEWYYRTYNGKKQKRLWSITEGKWLTDWINC